MNADSPRGGKALEALADHLRRRHEEILRAWEEKLRADPQMPTAGTLSSNHLRDLIPLILNRFDQRLRALPDGAEQELAEHGQHRWQQSYSLRELAVEWGHLQQIVMAEIDSFAQADLGLDPGAVSRGRQMWLELCGEGIADTVEKYHELHQAEAAGLLHDLQSGLEHARQLERERGQAWHEAAHDLRGNVGVVTSAAALLTEKDVPDPLRTKAVNILQSNVTFLMNLLEDLLALARLEAGREQRNLQAFDAAARLRELCSALEPVAEKKGLFLRTEGPAKLMVEGDPAKVQRIVQNLTLNALNYTSEGGVIVTWAETRERDVDRWLIRVQDTGPGIHVGPGSPIASHLEKATTSALKVEDRDPASGVEPVPVAASAAYATSGETLAPAVQRKGEGIGLSIVKRLCELLDASLELASTDTGTVFQVVLPCRYDTPGQREADAESEPLR
ncbi:MAG TPA: sensor histidine kinase [Thermoanaerobaculia bacterium]|nr:sensor histidine kinase [Thermoanaerobaculia bacterium]